MNNEFKCYKTYQVDEDNKFVTFVSKSCLMCALNK